MPVSPPYMNKVNAFIIRALFLSVKWENQINAALTNIPAADML